MKGVLIAVLLAGVVGAAFLIGRSSQSSVDTEPYSTIAAGALDDVDIGTGATAVNGELRNPRRGNASGAAREAASATLPPIDVPLADVVEQLDRLATAGNPVAACRLARLLPECLEIERLSRTLPAREQALESMAGKEPKVPEADLDGQIAEIAAIRNRIEAGRSGCGQIDPSRAFDLYRYRLTAAESGDVTAMRDFLNGQALEYDVFQLIDEYRTFPEDARRILERDVRAGDRYPLAQILIEHRMYMHTGRFLSRVYQTLQSKPADLEVFLEVARMLHFNAGTPELEVRIMDNMPSTLCPGDSKCPEIRARAASIAADMQRNTAIAYQKLHRKDPSLSSVQGCDLIDASS